METRSKSQSGRKESIMADENPIQSSGKSLLQSLDSTNNKKLRDKSEDAHHQEQLAQDTCMQQEAREDNAASIKGIVASRVEKINNSPLNSQIPPCKETATNRNKKRTKLKMVGAKNGKLSVEEEESDESCTEQTGGNNHDQQMDHASIADISGSDSLISILRDLSSTVKRLESKIDNMEKERKTNDETVRKLSMVQSQDSAAINNLTERAEGCEDKIQMLTGIITKQQLQIEELSHKLNNIYVNNNNKKLVINGLAETQGENCFHEVANFFKNIMKIDNQIPLKFARQIGTGAKRPMLMKLKSFEHKTLIFQKFDRLKQVNKNHQRPYFITEQLPEAWAERRCFIQHLKFQNSRLPAAARHDITVAKGTVKIDGTEFKQALQAPTIEEVVKLSSAERGMLQALEICEGKTETRDNSRFIGFAAEAYSVDKVKKLHVCLKRDHPNAAHVMMAYKIPGTDFLDSQGLVDDGEHGGARAIMRVLYKEKVDNIAVFVVRYFGGTHLGSTRFQAIEIVAKSAIDKHTQKQWEARRPPTQQELDQINADIQQVSQQQPVPYNWGDTEESQSDDEQFGQGQDQSSQEDE